MFQSYHFVSIAHEDMSVDRMTQFKFKIYCAIRFDKKFTEEYLKGRIVQGSMLNISLSMSVTLFILEI